LSFLAPLTILVAQCATPVRVAWEEERLNLITAVPVIRTNESRRPWESVYVQLVVDPSGRVVSAEALDSSQFADRAMSVAKTLRFRPFVRNSAAVEVQTEEHVLILPPEKVRANQVPFPKVDNLSSVEFSLKRTACFGSCPSYEVRVSGDGTVTYSGDGNVAVAGKHTDRIGEEKVQSLLDTFRKADSYSLDDKYFLNMTNGPTFIVGVKIGTNTKTVTDYMGQQVGMPLAVNALEDELDATGGTAKWLRGNSETVSSLRKEGFDLRSDAAGLILTRVAASGDEEVVRDFIDAGAPVGIVDQVEVTALANAAGSGKRLAVDLLIQHGADARNPRVLMEAARSGSPAAVSRVLLAGAEAKANIPGIRFLLFSAVSWHGRKGEGVDRGAVVRLLVKAGADPNIRDADGNTPLHGDLDEAAARALIDLRANVNAQNKRGETPLMWTSYENIVEILLNAGADIATRSGAGKTALDLARERHLSKIAGLIEKASNSQK
jgi:hypothetical protein